MVLLMILIFWDVILCHWVTGAQHFEGFLCHRVKQSKKNFVHGIPDPEDGGTTWSEGAQTGCYMIYERLTGQFKVPQQSIYTHLWRGISIVIVINRCVREPIILVYRHLLRGVRTVYYAHLQRGVRNVYESH